MNRVPVNRREFVQTAASLLAVRERPAQDGAVTGAIRWDAWHGSKSAAGKAVETSLGPAKWHYRLPFFADVISPSEVRIDGASQAVMDREIALASGAGLDYWAFVTYEPDSAMSLGLDYYLSSKHKKDIGFCLITEQGRWGNRRNYRQNIERFTRLMREDSYQKVMGKRPLFYLGFITDSRIEADWGSRAELHKALDEFRKAAIDAGLANPYIAIMDFSPKRGKQLADDLGADAVTAYATHANLSGAPYTSLAASAERFWDACAGAGASVIPIVMSGWDRRPRVEHPVPWEAARQKAGVGIEKYYETPRPEELAAHLKHGLEWVAAHPKAAPAKAVLIYAWNENDEGGWLVPTLAEGDARLTALRKVLRNE